MLYVQAATPHYQRQHYLTPEQLGGYAFDGMTTGELQNLLDLIDANMATNLELFQQLNEQSTAIKEQFDEIVAAIRDKREEQQVHDGEIRALEQEIAELKTVSDELLQQNTELQAEADDLATENDAYSEVFSEIEAIIARRGE